MPQSNQKPRVVVTGVGTINPLGHNVPAFWESLVQGRSGIKVWSSLDMEGVSCTVGGDLGDFNFKDAVANLNQKIPDALLVKLKRAFRSCTFSNKLTTLSAIEAYLDARLFGNPEDPFKTSVVVAGHNLNHNYILDNNLRYQKDRDSVDLFCGIEALDTTIAATLSELLEVKGAISTIGAACASGILALRSGYRDITSGEFDRSVIAGASFDICSSDIHSMTNVNAVVSDPALQVDPTRASRPFDVQRKGFVPSHGAGTIIIERLESAIKRGATIYGEILGIAAFSDASRYPAPSSIGQMKVIQRALEHAGIRAEEIDYINCHATSTKLGDLEEIEAIRGLFKPSSKLKLNAPKSMLGHLTWSAAVVELIGGLLQMKHGILHPSINIDELDPAIDFDVCANKAQKHDIRYFIKNAFGFGGINSSMVIKRYE